MRAGMLETKTGNVSSYDAYSNCVWVLDILSQKLHHHLDIEYKTLIPIMDDVRREYLHKSHSRPRYKGRSVAFGNQVVMFKRRNLALQLFKVMIEAPHQRLTRDQIAWQIYGCHIRSVSQRKRHSLQNSTNKLIRRVRKIAEYHLDCPNNPSWQWMSYEMSTKEYILIKPNLKVMR